MKGIKESLLKIEDKIEEGMEKEIEKVMKLEEVVKVELKEEVIFLFLVENYRLFFKLSLVWFKVSKGVGDFDMVEEIEKLGIERVEEIVLEIKIKVSFYYRRGLSYIFLEEIVVVFFVVFYCWWLSYSELFLEEVL